MLISAKLAPVFEYAVLEEFWRAADSLGFHAIWNYDHFYGLGHGLSHEDQPTLEAWTTLAAMGALTTRARIGCMVTGVTYRHPAVLANMAVSVDHISGGRLDFGIGAAWHEGEHAGYGIPFPVASERIERLDEALEIIKLLWAEPRATYAGRFWTLTEALCEPKPVQKPRPRIVIGGSGERKTLRVVAKHADEWNGLAPNAEEFARLSKILDEHCSAVGRDPSEIRRSVQLFVMPEIEGNIEQHLASLPAFADAGCEHAVFSFYSPPTRAHLEIVAAAAS
jgi:F420-dependent oxidoreductase-like protein